MKYWLVETIYRNAHDETYGRVRIYKTPKVYTAVDAVPDNEYIKRIEEVFEDDIELFDCEVVQ